MRKNLLALSLILPLLFLFSVFSAAKTVSLGVQVSASGIELLAPENGYRIDISAPQEEIQIKAKVLPEAASERGYTLRAEGEAITVENGILRANGVGEGTVTAVSRDGGFTDSVKVVVYASSPYDITFSLYDGAGESLLQETDGGYFARLATGVYSYAARAVPSGAVPELFASEFVLPDRAAGTLFLPFGGEHTLTLSATGRFKGEELSLQKTVTLLCETPKTASGFSVNGGNPVLKAERAGAGLSFFIEGEEEPFIAPNEHITESNIEPLGGNRYRANIVFGGEREDFTFFVQNGAGDKREEGKVTFADFDFSIRPELPVQTDEPSILIGEPVSFYAVPALPAEGVTYTWEVEGDAALSPAGGVCTVTAGRTGELTLRVKAFRGELLAERELRVYCVRRVRTLQFADKTDLGLARSLVVAGQKYEDGKLAQNKFLLHPVLTDGMTELSGTEDILFSVSGNAQIERENGGPMLLPTGRGEVTVTAEWRGNGSYGERVQTSLSLFVAGDGVEVKTSGELFQAEREKRDAVLSADILLGADEKGDPLPAQERAALLNEMPSTFNTAYYQNASTERPENAKIKYVLEFTGNVYGNGHEVSAELFTAEKDGAVPRFFRGPLCFVKFGQLASVAAQDNISFLVRTDGIVLHNLTLLGCGDEELKTEEGYDLSRLNTVGTVLELNGSCRLLNCRVRNGRTVVRAYGGNREGDRYFSPRPAAEERILVHIEGCHLSQGREFLLKLGANAAVRADANNVEPDLFSYPLEGERGENFYRDCVMTDVTLKDSVLEKSGLFCIGVESNFSGPLLASGGGGGFDGWAGTGGTSYASLLRLEGEVRLYDWKDVSLIDSSTLIETELDELKLDLAAMLSFVASREPEKYGELLEEAEGKQFVHGGVAFYGGGKNYSLLEDHTARGGLAEYRVNLSVLSGAEGNTGYLGQILPAAAGSNDFRFYLYGKSGPNSRAVQQKEAEEGVKYEKISPLAPFSYKKELQSAVQNGIMKTA